MALRQTIFGRQRQKWHAEIDSSGLFFGRGRAERRELSASS
jgi:hypothetical protein